MDPWSETYRGAASPWECDVTEHFTLAFYADRIAMAEANFAEELGLLDTLRQGGFTRALRHPARARSYAPAQRLSHRQQSARPGDGGLRVGHRVVNSVTGETATWFDVQWDGVEPRLASGRVAEWDGPSFEKRPEPADFAHMIPSMAGRVQPGEISTNSAAWVCAAWFTNSAMRRCSSAPRLALPRITSRTPGAAFSASRSCGCGSPVLPQLGEAYRIDTGLAHLGTSSLRYLHVMRDPATGEEIARADRYGVQLDLDARRPAPLAPELRERAQRLLLAMA